jgi:hypothetical protein
MSPWETDRPCVLQTLQCFVSRLYGHIATGMVHCWSACALALVAAVQSIGIDIEHPNTTAASYAVSSCIDHDREWPLSDISLLRTSRCRIRKNPCEFSVVSSAEILNRGPVSWPVLSKGLAHVCVHLTGLCAQAGDTLGMNLKCMCLPVACPISITSEHGLPSRGHLLLVVPVQY